MKRWYRSALFSFLILFFAVPFSMGQFGLSGELRVRPEFRRGYKSLATSDQDPAFFISQRTRLKLHYGAERFAFHVAIQDVRTWGSTSQLNISDDFLSLHEAWVALIVAEGIQLKAGRQELAYDNHRILGNVNWAQQGRSHDLIMVTVENDRFKWHTGVAYNQNQEQLSTHFYSVANNYKTMQFIWLHADLERAGGSLLLLNNGLQNADSSMSYSQTVGTYLNFELGGLNLNLAGYYQTGKDALKRDLSAAYVSFELTWPTNFGLTPSLGLEYLSGTDQGNALTNHSFTPLYGTNHKFNGHMDYFYVGNHLNNVGLTNPYLGLVYSLNTWTLGGAVHYFASSGKILDPAAPTNTLGNYLGTEIDLSLSRKITDNFILSAGYSRMFATTSMAAIKGGDSSTANHWAWLMLTFTPELIKATKTE